MKYIISKYIAFTAIIALGTMTACIDDETTKLPQQLETWRARSITSTSAELSGFVVAEGDGLTETGVVYGTSANPTVDDNKVTPDSLTNAVYWVSLNNLDHLTTYYFRAYAMNMSGAAVYGEESSFSTLANIATVETTSVSDITDLTALVTANVPYDGKSEVTARGICWNTEANPTTDNYKVTSGDGTGEFIGLLENLYGKTTYYVRSYATNAIGTAYSSETSFTTPAGTPRITLHTVEAIEKTTATVITELTNSGGEDVTETGICYALTNNPTVDNMKMVSEVNELDSMEYMIEGLEMNTTYYVRAYAINSVGTTYTNEIEFTTLANITTWYLPGDYLEASYPTSGFANWSPDKSPSIMNTLENPNSLEGYVYFANDGSQWKFASTQSWDDPNYTANDQGQLTTDGDNLNFEAGYYKVNVDLSKDPMEFKAMKTIWGVIGDATPGGWDTDTDLEYNPESQHWEGAVHLAAGSYKFRANDGWDLNYGGGNTLSQNGDNIANDVEADYVFTLDFSSPQNYMYHANRWGVIGEATPGGWDTDTDMTWDAENRVLTVTLDLTQAQLKFRANDGWDLNLGGSLDALVENGDNIDVPEAGNYTITLDPFTRIATIIKN